MGGERWGGLPVINIHIGIIKVVRRGLVAMARHGCSCISSQTSSPIVLIELPRARSVVFLLRP